MIRHFRNETMHKGANGVRDICKFGMIWYSTPTSEFLRGIIASCGQLEITSRSISRIDPCFSFDLMVCSVSGDLPVL